MSGGHTSNTVGLAIDVGSLLLDHPGGQTSDLLFARGQMALSLAFHIVFAAVGVALPALMVLAEWRWRRTGDAVYLELAHRWAKGTAVLFAVGAVSGTVLSFELGLLWPRFMALAGGIIGMPFSLEGFAFFTEAIFLGIYLYGWDRVPGRLHVAAGVAVVLSGAASAFFVVLANAWMNAPFGFRLVDGRVVDVDPLAAMFSPGWSVEVLHALLASYLATAAAMAAIHAWLLRANTASRFHRAAYGLAMAVTAAAALLQPLSGDASARQVAVRQPAKLAAMEGQFRTDRGAPLTLGGWPDPAAHRTRHGLSIPHGLSLLAFHTRDAEVRGLDSFPERDRPDPRIVHLAFEVMVAAGSLLFVVSLAWLGLFALHRRLPTESPLLLAVACVGPLGFVALEAGWVVTEVGRQPWTIQGLVRTADAVTPATGLAGPFAVVTLLYLVLGGVVVALLLRMIRQTGGGRD
jgi:cytochrome d ubiquinol oxidase subunit I